MIMEGDTNQHLLWTNYVPDMLLDVSMCPTADMWGRYSLLGIRNRRTVSWSTVSHSSEVTKPEAASILWITIYPTSQVDIHSILFSFLAPGFLSYLIKLYKANIYNEYMPISKFKIKLKLKISLYINGNINILNIHSNLSKSCKLIWLNISFKWIYVEFQDFE